MRNARKSGLFEEHREQVRRVERAVGLGKSALNFSNRPNMIRGNDLGSCLLIRNNRTGREAELHVISARMADKSVKSALRLVNPETGKEIRSTLLNLSDQRYGFDLAAVVVATDMFLEGTLDSPPAGTSVH